MPARWQQHSPKGFLTIYSNFFVHGVVVAGTGWGASETGATQGDRVRRRIQLNAQAVRTDAGKLGYDNERIASIEYVDGGRPRGAGRQFKDGTEAAFRAQSGAAAARIHN